MQPALVDRVLEMACEIQQIPSPTFSEEQRAAFVLDQFKQSGIQQVFRDDVGNVIARIPGYGKADPVIVSAHLDTVFPSSTHLGLRKESSKIFGPGIGDNSLGVASLFGLAWELLAETSDKENPVCSSLPGDVWLVANVGEEGLGDLVGMKAVVDRFKNQVKAYLVLEGMSLGHIYHRALGVHRFKITARTAGGHSWVDYGKPSAIHELSHLVGRITSMKVPLVPRTTYNIGVISGGTSINTIASEATIELDLRSEEFNALKLLVSQVHDIVNKSQKMGVEMTIETIGSRPAGELPISHPLIRLAQKALEVNGFKPNLIIGSTDANIPLSLGYPAICIGITHGSKAHTVGEFIWTHPVEKGLSQLIYLVREIFTEV